MTGRVGLRDTRATLTRVGGRYVCFRVRLPLSYKDVRLTPTEVKTYKNRLETFELFYPFAIILIHKQNFQRSIPAYFARKRIAQMR